MKVYLHKVVCHETYKDENGDWLSPDEVFLENKVYKSKNPKDKIKVTSESMSKSKKM